MNQARHPNGYSDFTLVDDRCIGGKTLIVQHMKNHYDQLKETKPQLKIEAPKKYIHESRKPVHQQKNKLIDENLEVKVAMRKVAQTKAGYIDTKKPISYDMTANLKGRYEKEKKHEQQEHELNIRSMQKKLGVKGKPMKDRKKDPSDPIANPVVLFRRDKELPNKKIEYLTTIPAGSRLVINEADAGLKKRLDSKSQFRGLKSTVSQQHASGLQNRPNSVSGFRFEAAQGDQSAAPQKPATAMAGSACSPQGRKTRAIRKQQEPSSLSTKRWRCGRSRETREQSA